MDLCLIADGSILDSIGFYSWNILKVLLGLGLVIFVHELGHFLVAKACGVKCEKFYLGFDAPLRIGPIRLPSTLAKFTWGETEYGIGIIPLGGYVKMLGQDDNPANAEQEAERIRVKKTADDGETADGKEEYELDPRSFPAKSVPQRMAIISAGVIMNLIFAVILGASAYRMGVKYEPCEIGGTQPGSPAWTQNIPIGSQIVQMGEKGKRSEHLRFDWDLRQYVFMTALDGKAAQFVVETPDGSEKDYSIVPDDKLMKLEIAPAPTIGVLAARSNTVSSTQPAVEFMPAGQVDPAFKAQDRIVGVNGKLFSTEGANGKGEIPAYELEHMLATKPHEPLTFQVERKEQSASGEETVRTMDITVPPNMRRLVGLQMEMGPIEAVRKGSPAEEAGFEVGDLILTVNGQDVENPLLLEQRFRPWIGETIPITVQRKVDGKIQELALQVTPEDRFQFQGFLPPGAEPAIEPIGIAYSVKDTVAAVEPGSAAAEAGMQPGDAIKEVEFAIKTDEARERVEERFGSAERFEEPVEFVEGVCMWPYVANTLQQVPEGVNLKVTYERSGKILTANLTPERSEKWYYADRGLRLMPMNRIQKATSWSEAWQLGFHETVAKFFDVIGFVRKLVSGKVSVSNVGGPVAIATVAGREASEGIPRLLIFLTFLSANLAVLNFLPYPALDGGHMVFLTAEAVMGKPVSERVQGTLTLIGVVALLAFFLFVTWNDIERLLS